MKVIKSYLIGDEIPDDAKFLVKKRGNQADRFYFLVEKSDLTPTEDNQ